MLRTAAAINETRGGAIRPLQSPQTRRDIAPDRPRSHAVNRIRPDHRPARVLLLRALVVCPQRPAVDRPAPIGIIVLSDQPGDRAVLLIPQRQQEQREAPELPHAAVDAL